MDEIIVITACYILGVPIIFGGALYFAHLLDHPKCKNCKKHTTKVVTHTVVYSDGGDFYEGDNYCYRNVGYDCNCGYKHRKKHFKDFKI